MAIYKNVDGTMKRMVDLRCPTQDSGGSDVDQFASVYQGENLIHKNIIYETADGARHILAKRLGAEDTPFYNQGLSPTKIIQGSTNGVTKFDNLFNGLTTLTEFVCDIDTSKVTHFYAMFSNCSGLTSIDVSGFDMSKATSTGSMFYNCTNLSTVNVIGLDISSVDSFLGMFQNCKSLSTIDFSGWNTIAAKNFGAFVQGCSELTSIDVSGFVTSKVENFSYMFNGCSKLTSLDVSGFNTSNATNMSSMFNGCSKLTSLDVSGFNTSNVTNFSYMFNNCASLTSLNVSGFDTIKATNVGNIFRFCTKVTNLSISSDFFNAAIRASSPLSDFDFLGLTNWIDVTEITSLLNCLPVVSQCNISFSANTKNVIVSNGLETIATNKGWTIA